MDFIGNKIWRLLFIVGAVLLCVLVVWPFLSGGGPSIHSAFRPMNGQMEELLLQANTTPTLKAKATPSPKALASPPQGQKSNSALPAKDSSIPVPTPIPSEIPKPQSASSPPPSTKSTPPSNAPQSERLDLNKATLEQLDKLPGIGESKAKAILDYRLQKGRFKRVEDLMDVKGIGEKMLEKLKDLVYVTTS